jgi:hypothetical protein
VPIQGHAYTDNVIAFLETPTKFPAVKRRRMQASIMLEAIDSIDSDRGFTSEVRSSHANQVWPVSKAPLSERL